MRWTFPRFKKAYHSGCRERNRKPDWYLESPLNSLKGFTILEIMVALAIMGISLSIFFSLIGNSSRLRGRIDEHTKLASLARTKTEEAFLGILEGNYTAMGEKNIFEGKTKDNIQWKITESTKSKEEKKIGASTIPLRRKNPDDDCTLLSLPEGIVLVNTQVGVINIDTIVFFGEFINNRGTIEGEGKGAGADNPE
jgi:prepilin-type N-terminal cleavage/methylation domain-containing protein